MFRQKLSHLLALMMPLGGSALGAAGDGGDLFLAATVGDERLTQLAVEDDRIVSRDRGESSPVPAAAVWQLTGNLRAHSDLFYLAPEYEIINRPSVVEADPTPVLRHAVIRPRRHASWTEADLSGGVVVFVWILDRKPVLVVPVPATDPKGAAAEYAAVTTLPLTEATARGVPVVLLWKNGRFVPPVAWFKDATANAALAAMHLEWTDEARARLAELRDPVQRAESRARRGEARSAIRIFAAITTGEVETVMIDRPPSLLEFAAAGGFTDVIKALFDRGVTISPDDEKTWGPLHAAARNGRYEAVELLLAHRPADIRGKTDGPSPFDVAMSNGHVAVASLLTSDPLAPGLDKVAHMAVAFGDETAIRNLSSKGASANIVGLPEGLLARPFQGGDPRVAQALLDAGLSPNATAGGTPMLVLAAASGKVECVQVLLRAGAFAEGRATGGITPLMTAVTTGSAEVVQALRAAGATVVAADDQGRTALHYAVLAGKADLLPLLRDDRAHTLADQGGSTPLQLALGLQSRPMVDTLVNFGARLPDQEVSNPTTIQQCLAVDAVALLEQAVAAGWTLDRKFSEQWSIGQVATLHDAERCAAWLAAHAATQAADHVPVLKGDAAPAAIGGENPAEPRRAEEFFPADPVKVTGIVSAEGQFLFPRILTCRDARTGAAVLSATTSWRFRPATRQGAVVASRLTMVIPFPARDRRVQSAFGLEAAPAALKLVAADPDIVSGYTDKELHSVTTPVYRLRGAETPGGDVVDHTEIRFRPEYRNEVATYHWAAVTCIVEPDGKPTAVQVIGAVSVSYARAVEKALQQSTFRPAQAGGQPLRARITLTFPFPGP